MLSILFWYCIIFPLPKAVFAEETKPGEYQVKAAFLYNFAKFVEWPDEVSKNTAPIILCVLGKNLFDGDIDIIQGKPVKGRILAVKHASSIQEVGNCQILFISSSEKNRITQILHELRDYSIFTIGDSEGFAQQGVIINFYIEQDKVRFEINVDAARQARIRISSRLLKLARIIENKINR